MLQLLELKEILKWLAIITTALSTGIYYCVQKFVFHDWSVLKIVTLASAVASTLVAISLSNFVSRRVWRLLRRWNKSLYPDLTGCWRGKISPTAGPIIEVRATIRHSPTGIQIDFHGPSFKSITLAATPTVEQGHQYLYYVYLADPRNPKHPPYKGTAVLRVRSDVANNNRAELSLSGQYYTVRKTVGTIELKQESTDVNQDMSYY